MELFILNEKDYTSHIVVPSYKVQSEPVTKTWEDTLYKNHKDLLRWRVKGSFTIYFDDITEFHEFLDELENLRGNDNYTEATFYDNRRHAQHESRYEIKITISNNLPYYGIKSHDGYDVQIEEQ